MPHLEFLDTEWYRVKHFLTKPVNHFYLDIDDVKLFSQTTRIKYIWQNEQQIVDDLATDIQSNGLKNPLIFKLDNYSSVSLYDGHHRLIATELLGFKRLPVRVERCELLRIESRHVSELIRCLI